MNLMQFLQDNAGANSSGRLMQVGTAAIIVLVWLMSNVSAFIVAVSGHALFKVMPMDSYMLCALGIIFGANIFKTVAEGKEPPK